MSLLRLRISLRAIVTARLFALGIVFIGTLSSIAKAHPVGFGVLDWLETSPRTYEVSLRLSAGVTRELSPEVPVGCQPVSPTEVRVVGSAVHQRLEVRCEQRPSEIGLAQIPTDLQVRLRLRELRQSREPQNGRSRVGSDDYEEAMMVMLDAAHPRWSLSAPSASHLSSETSGTLSRYLAIGFEHILEGYDHLAFLAGLILLLFVQEPQMKPALRRAAMATAAFTVGHSLTLAWVSFGGAAFPSSVTEACIALSIVLLFREALLSTKSEHSKAAGSIGTRPEAVALPFGAVHGLGFAGALAEIGLAPGNELVSLLGFNLGVEAGQLCVVLILFPLLFGMRRFEPLSSRGIRWVSLGLGSLGAFWLIERVSGFPIFQH